MTMPIDLVLVRHGESEQNYAFSAARTGDLSLITMSFLARPPSRHRLTTKGTLQAEVTGQWLRDEGMERFDRRYVSEYVRARETAAHLGLDGPEWYVEHGLREREWGELDGMSWENREAYFSNLSWAPQTDSFYWVPPNGESIAQLTNRLRFLLDTMHRECGDKRVIVVCHGEVMWTFRFLLERMDTQQWMQLEASDEPGVKMYNCQVLHYTRRNPETRELAAHLNWMRSVCPNEPANSLPGWQTIERKTFTDAQLFEAIESVPRLYDQ